MKKLIIILTIALYGCGDSETKKESGLDSLSAAMDSIRASDTFLLKLRLQDSIKSDTTIKTKQQ